MKVTIHPETSNRCVPNFIKPSLDINSKISLNTVIASDFSTPTFTIGQIICTKNRNTRVNEITVQMDFIDISSTFLPNTAKYTFFSVACGIFSKIDHMLGHKASFNKYRKIEITSCSSFISVAVIKYPDKEQHSGKTVYVVYNSMLQPIIVWKSQEQELETPGHNISKVKSRET